MAEATAISLNGRLQNFVPLEFYNALNRNNTFPMFFEFVFLLRLCYNYILYNVHSDWLKAMLPRIREK